MSFLTNLTLASEAIAPRDVPGVSLGENRYSLEVVRGIGARPSHPALAGPLKSLS